MNKRFDDTIIWKIIKLWPILLALIMASIAYGTIKNTVEEHSLRLIKLEEIIFQIPEIKTDIKHILKHLNEKD